MGGGGIPNADSSWKRHDHNSKSQHFLTMTNELKILLNATIAVS